MLSSRILALPQVFGLMSLWLGGAGCGVVSIVYRALKYVFLCKSGNGMKGLLLLTFSDSHSSTFSDSRCVCRALASDSAS